MEEGVEPPPALEALHAGQLRPWSVLPSQLARTSSFPPFFHSLPLRCPPLTPYPPGLSLPSVLDWNHRPSSGTVTTQQSCTPVLMILVKILRSGEQPSRAFKGSQRREPWTLIRSHGPLSHPLTAPPWQAFFPGLGASVPSPPLSGLLSAAGETQTPQHYDTLRLPAQPHQPARTANLRLVVFKLPLFWAPCPLLTPGLMLSDLSTTGKQN